MDKQVLNIGNIKGMYRSEGTDLPPDMVYNMENLLTDTTVGMLEGAKDYTEMRVIGAMEGEGFVGALNGAEVYDMVFFSPSKAMVFNFGMNDYKTRRIAVALVNDGDIKLKLFPVIDDEVIIYHQSKDVLVPNAESAISGKLITTGESLRIVLETEDEPIVKWFGHLSKYMIYIDGVPELDLDDWVVEDAIVGASGFTISIAEGEDDLYEEDDDLRYTTMAISPVYDFIQDGDLIYTKTLDTKKEIVLSIGIDIRHPSEGGISRRLSGIKVWRKVGMQSAVVADMDWELVKSYGLAYDTNEDFDYVLYSTMDRPSEMRATKHLAGYKEWVPNSPQSMEYTDEAVILPHTRWPLWKYYLRVDKDQFTPVDGQTYFIGYTAEAPLSPYCAGESIERRLGKYRFDGATAESTLDGGHLIWKTLWHIDAWHDDFLELSLVYGLVDTNDDNKLINSVDPDHEEISTFDLYSRASAPIEANLVYKGEIHTYNRNEEDGDIKQSGRYLISKTGNMEDNALNSKVINVFGNFPELAYMGMGTKIELSTEKYIDLGLGADMYGDTVDADYIPGYTSDVPEYNEPLGNWTLSPSWQIEKDDSLLMNGLARRLTVSVTNVAGAVVSFERDGDAHVLMTLNEKSPDDLHTNRFYTEEVGFDSRNLVEGYTDGVWFANRMFVIDGPRIRWSDSFKYDSFRPANAYEAKQRPLGILPHRNVLMALYETDIEILDYSGTEETWKTKDTLDKTGSSILSSFVSTPSGVFYVSRYGIFKLSMPEQTGLHSYFRKERLDEPLGDLVDYRTAVDGDIIGYYDPSMNRVIFRDNRNDSEFILNRSGGWMPVVDSDFGGISKVITAHDNLMIGLGENSVNQSALLNLERNGRDVGNYLLETNWIDLGQAHVDKKFVRADMLIEMPSAESVPIEVIQDIGVVGGNNPPDDVEF